MTGDPPRRWPDDSPEEDFKVHQAREEDRMKVWVAEQKARPLTDTLQEHGLLPGDDSEGCAGLVILPDWWDEIPEPGHCCPWCQRPGVPSPCPECREARATDVDPPAAWVWWASLTAGARRAHIAARFGTDQGQISTTNLPYSGAAPDGIYWGTVRRA